MRFHVLLPVRDEADIIDQCLTHALRWADAIYVFDTGSVDDTWEIVQEFARRDKRVRPVRRDPVFFSETHLRGWIFNHARQFMRTGDWFLRADADEFHHLAPPDFVKAELAPHETIAWHQYYNFELTESECASWQAAPNALQDRRRPIEERRRWFTMSEYSEPRLCRYRESMRWPSSTSFPYNSGYVARARLPIRHYPHRDPDQMRRRCLLRAVMMADEGNRTHWSNPEAHHWSEQEWRKFVVPDNHAGLREWRPGEALPAPTSTSHLAPPPKRAVQRLVHAFALPLLDARRPGWSDGTYPAKISPRTVAELEKQLAVPDGHQSASRQPSSQPSS